VSTDSTTRAKAPSGSQRVLVSTYVGDGGKDGMIGRIVE
jgi:hypothetical protein